MRLQDYEVAVGTVGRGLDAQSHHREVHHHGSWFGSMLFGWPEYGFVQSFLLVPDLPPRVRYLNPRVLARNGVHAWQFLPSPLAIPGKSGRLMYALDLLLPEERLYSLKVVSSWQNLRLGYPKGAHLRDHTSGHSPKATYPALDPKEAELRTQLQQPCFSRWSKYAECARSAL